MDDNSSTKPSLIERWKAPRALRTRNKVLIIIGALLVIGLIFSPADDGDSDKAEASTSKAEPDKRAHKPKAEKSEAKPKPKPTAPEQKMIDGIKKAGTSVKVNVRASRLTLSLTSRTGSLRATLGVTPSAK